MIFVTNVTCNIWSLFSLFIVKIGYTEETCWNLEHDTKFAFYLLKVRRCWMSYNHFSKLKYNLVILFVLFKITKIKSEKRVEPHDMRHWTLTRLCSHDWRVYWQKTIISEELHCRVHGRFFFTTSIKQNFFISRWEKSLSFVCLNSSKTHYLNVGLLISFLSFSWPNKVP